MMDQVWNFEDLQVQGLSLSGIRTSLAIPELSACFDVAQGLPFNLNFKDYFITHGHMDHAGGIPYIISQKALMHHEPPRFYMPPSLIEPLQKIIQQWEFIEKHQYRFEFIPIDENSEILLKNNFLVQPFRTVHRIESYGYSVYKLQKKLHPQYQGLKHHELAELARQKVEVNQVIRTQLCAFTGDTQIEFIHNNPHVAEAEVLFMECTYLDDKKSIAKAREWGHIHLDELLQNFSLFQNKKIVLIHVSSRYSFPEIQQILKQKMSPEQLSRIAVFPGR